MVDEPGRVGTWTLRALVYGGALVGLALLVMAAVAADPPRWWWPAGGILTLVCGGLASIWIRFRLQHTPEQRRERIAQLAARRELLGLPLERSRIAYRATKHKKAVLRSGVDGMAVVTFLADGGRANDHHQLVYLELDVRVAGGPPVEVRTGEFVTAASAGTLAPGRELMIKVDPDDSQRVAVDWERSLRLR